MKHVIIPYETADGEIVLVVVNTGTVVALVETENKQKALDKQDERHVDYEEEPDVRAAHFFEPPLSLEDQYIHKEEIQELHKALRHLTKTQMRRIRAHFFDGLTFRQIARQERVALVSVEDSIYSAIKKLKKLLERPRTKRL